MQTAFHRKLRFAGFLVPSCPKRALAWGTVVRGFVHMIDKQKADILKSKQYFNKNKEKISQNIKYAEISKLYQSYVLMQQWHVMYFLL